MTTQLSRRTALISDAAAFSMIATMSTLFAATLGGPLVKTAAFTYGVRKAFQGRRKK